MVDVSTKVATARSAHAQALVIVPEHVMNLIKPRHDSSSSNRGNGNHENEVYSAKGPVFATAIVAGVMGAKNTANMIPFCHPLPLDFCDIAITVDEQRVHTIRIECTTKTTHKTVRGFSFLIFHNLLSFSLLYLLTYPSFSDLHTNRSTITITTSISAKGVEMEALVGATQAALCVYDMLKAMSHDIVITEIKLLSKRGGKSDYPLAKPS